MYFPSINWVCLFPVMSRTKNSAYFIYHLIEFWLVAQDVKNLFLFLCEAERKHLSMCLQKRSILLKSDLNYRRSTSQKTFPCGLGVKSGCGNTLSPCLCWVFVLQRRIPIWLMTWDHGGVTDKWENKTYAIRISYHWLVNTFLDDTDYTFIRYHSLCLDSDKMKFARE